jgi:hypothetical protein
MKCSVGLPTECVCCNTQTVMRLNGQPVCLDCAAYEPPPPRVREKVFGNCSSEALNLSLLDSRTPNVLQG